ncbi:MAG TPA: phage holin family protein [Pyrinomonadaceae bacterium]|jgi:Flp pilus assembly protein TadB
MMQQPMTKDERGIGDLFSELANETGTLIRQEVSLAQAEMTKKATDAGKNAASIAIGGFVGYAAFLALLAAIIAVLSIAIPVWLAALIVAIVVGVVAFYMINSALAKLKKTDLAPRETVTTLKEDAQWLKKQVS